MRFPFISYILLIVISALASGCFSDTSEQYVNDLKSNNISVRKNAVYYLGKDKASDAAPILAQLFKDDHSKEVRLYIIDALAELSEKSSGSVLIDILNENDSEIQLAAIDALGKLVATDAVYPLISLLDTEDRLLKLTAFRALGNIKDASAVPALTMFLNHDDKFVRYNAAQALKRIGERE